MINILINIGAAVDPRKSEEQKKIDLETDPYQRDYLVKTIRAEEFGNVLNQFNYNTKSCRYAVYSFTNPPKVQKNEYYKYRRPVRATQLKNKYQYKRTTKGVVTRDTHLWTEEEKESYSKQFCFFYINPRQNYFPRPPDIDKKGVRVAIAVPPELVKIQRIAVEDISSYFYTYMYENKEDADNASGKFVNTLEDIVTHCATKRAHNEVMGRVRIDPNPAYYAQVLVEQNNLESRLVAQIRAKDLTLRLQKIYPSLSPDYIVPLGFYLVEEKKPFRSYPVEEQTNDLEKALRHSDPKISGLAWLLKLQQQTFTFEFKENSFNQDQLTMIIKEATSLTWESGLLFYKNFFLKNKELILKQLQRHDRMDLLMDISNCVPLENRKELVWNLCTTPELKSYYLYSLMNLDCLEHDEEELITLLDSKETFNFSIKLFNSDTLYDYAVKHFLFNIADKIGQKDKNLINNTVELWGETLIAAIKLGNMDAAKEILKRHPQSLKHFDTYRKTPLDWAVFHKNFELTHLIISTYQNINIEGLSYFIEQNKNNDKNLINNIFLQILKQHFNQTENKEHEELKRCLQNIEKETLEKKCPNWENLLNQLSQHTLFLIKNNHFESATVIIITCPLSLIENKIEEGTIKKLHDKLHEAIEQLDLPRILQIKNLLLVILKNSNNQNFKYLKEWTRDKLLQYLDDNRNDQFKNALQYLPDFLQNVFSDAKESPLLIEAARKGNFEIVNMMLEKNINKEIKCQDKTYQGHYIEGVRYLIVNDKTFDALELVSKHLQLSNEEQKILEKDFTTLQYELRDKIKDYSQNLSNESVKNLENALEIIQHIPYYYKKADIKKCIFEAAYFGNLEALKLLKKYGANFDGCDIYERDLYDCLKLCIVNLEKNKNYDKIAEIIKCYPEVYPKFLSLDKPILKRIVRNFIKNEENKSERDYKLIKKILENFKNESLDELSPEPLVHFCLDYPSALENLIKNLEINAQDNKGCTALHVAAQKNNNLSLIPKLIENNINIHMEDSKNKTAFDYGDEQTKALILMLTLEKLIKNYFGDNFPALVLRQLELINNSLIDEKPVDYPSVVKKLQEIATAKPVSLSQDLFLPAPRSSTLDKYLSIFNTDDQNLNERIYSNIRLFEKEMHSTITNTINHGQN